MRKFLPCAFFVSLFVFSCKPHGRQIVVDSLPDSVRVAPVPAAARVPDTFVAPELQKTAETTEWTSMNGYPEESEGCSCAFAENDTAYSKDKFLFVLDFDSTAIVSVNKELAHLYLRKTNREKDAFYGDTISNIYSNTFYLLEIHAVYKKSAGDEVDAYSGEAILKSATKEIHKKISGTCGC